MSGLDISCVNILEETNNRQFSAGEEVWRYRVSELLVAHEDFCAEIKRRQRVHVTLGRLHMNTTHQELLSHVNRRLDVRSF